MYIVGINFRNTLLLFITPTLPYKILGNPLDNRTVLFQSLGSLDDLLKGHHTVKEM